MGPVSSHRPGSKSGKDGRGAAADRSNVLKQTRSSRPQKADDTSQPTRCVKRVARSAFYTASRKPLALKAVAVTGLATHVATALDAGRALSAADPTSSAAGFGASAAEIIGSVSSAIEPLILLIDLVTITQTVTFRRRFRLMQALQFVLVAIECARLFVDEDNVTCFGLDILADSIPQLARLALAVMA